ncbi:MAG: porin [Polyangiales bacterium]
MLVMASPAGALAQAPEAGTEERLSEVEDRLDAWDRLDITGYVQPQLKYENEPGEPAETFFEIRRGRLKTIYTWDWAEFALEIDASSGGVSLKDANASFTFPTPDALELELVVGQFKTPFGIEVQGSSSKRPFPERSLGARLFFPGERDLGVMLTGTAADELVYFDLAALNGQPLGDAFRGDFPEVDPNRQKDLLAHAGVELGPVRAGASGLWGEGRRPAVEDDPDTMMDESMPAYGVDRWAVGGELKLVQELPVIGDLTVQSEVIRARNLARKRAGDYPQLVGGEVQDRDAIAWYAGVMQHLTRWVAVGARVAQYLPDDAEDVTLINPNVLVFPADWARVSISWQLDAETPESSEGWLRAQLKF